MSAENKYRQGDIVVVKTKGWEGRGVVRRRYEDSYDHYCIGMLSGPRKRSDGDFEPDEFESYKLEEGDVVDVKGLEGLYRIIHPKYGDLCIVRDEKKHMKLEIVSARRVTHHQKEESEAVNNRKKFEVGDEVQVELQYAWNWNGRGIVREVEDINEDSYLVEMISGQQRGRMTRLLPKYMSKIEQVKTLEEQIAEAQAECDEKWDTVGRVKKVLWNAEIAHSKAASKLKGLQFEHEKAEPAEVKMPTTKKAFLLNVGDMLMPDGEFRAVRSIRECGGTSEIAIELEGGGEVFMSRNCDVLVFNDVKVNEHEHVWVRHRNVTSRGYEMPPYEECVCDTARKGRNRNAQDSK